jgi:y4mF family transcriptional regulator
MVNSRQYYKRTMCLYPKGAFMELSTEIKTMRKAAGLTQNEVSKRAGVGLRFVRELEQGKPTVRLDKVKQVLDLLGHELCIRRKS